MVLLLGRCICADSATGTLPFIIAEVYVSFYLCKAEGGASVEVFSFAEDSGTRRVLLLFLFADLLCIVKCVYVLMY